MSDKPNFRVPKEFPSVLKAFSREVLRNNPADIYEFGASYFAELLDQVRARGGGSAKPPAPRPRHCGRGSAAGPTAALLRAASARCRRHAMQVQWQW